MKTIFIRNRKLIGLSMWGTLLFVVSILFYQGATKTAQAAPNQDGNVTGTVTEALNGFLIQGVDVCFQEYGGSYTWNLCSATGADGNYSITLAPGVYEVRASKPGYAFEYYDNAYNYTQRAPVTVSSGGTTAGIDFELAHGGTISGVVLETGSAKPLQGFHVELLYPDGIRQVAATAPDGTYQFNDVPFNENFYVFAWEWPDGGTHEMKFWDNAYGWDTATPISVTAASSTRTHIDFSLAQMGSVSGTVTEAASGFPIQDVEVCFQTYSGPYTWDICGPTDSNGDYSIGLFPGTYEARARKSGYAFEFYDNAYNYTQRTPISVSPGIDTAGINFALAPGGAISGMVLETGSEKPLEGFHVELLFPDGIRQVEATDPHGAYRFDDVPFDIDFYVFAWEWPDGGTHEMKFWDDAYDWDTASTVSVTASSSWLTGINISLGVLGTITETVVYTDTGGVIQFENDQGMVTTIAIPAGAVTDTTTIVYDEMDVPPGGVPNGFTLAGDFFSLTAYQDGAPLDNLDLSKPVTMTVSYNEADLHGIQETSLVLMYWDAQLDQWLDAACGPYDRHPDENWLSVPICHFSDFGLLGDSTRIVYLPLTSR